MAAGEVIAHRSGDAPPWHSVPVERALDLVGSGRAGLSGTEAEARRQRYGRNVLPGRRRPTIAGLFVGQFRSPLIYLLLGAAAISLASGHLLDAAFIALVLLINAAVGTIQEWRADTSMAALDRLIRHRARVRRDGSVIEVDAAELVPGDIVEIESGMAVPADLRLVSSANLRADESLLSGESLPAPKAAEGEVAAAAGLAERPTMLHAGTTVVQGRAAGVAVATAADTQLGLIQSSLGRSSAAPPPLVLRLRRLGRQIAAAAVALIVSLAIVLALRGAAPADIMVLAVALAVSAIPEGLPIAVTVALASATRRMAARNVIVRALPAVEGLGSCTLIASDKTGTLTLNRLSVEQILLATGELLGPRRWSGEHPPLRRLAEAAAFCNEASVGPGGMLLGDTVDVALLEFARGAGIDLAEARSAPRLAEIPYEPANRFSAVTVRAGGEARLFVKGAPEVVLPMCRGVEPALVEQAEALGSRGYRLIAVATAAGGETVEDGRLPCDGELLGWIGLLDPLRPEAAAAVRRCADAGISVRMITGDHPATARTIAEQLGLICSAGEVVTGGQIAAAADDPAELERLIVGGRVFARIEPNQKFLIVETLRAAGEIVAVTGDGVNDAPALQAAHIGVAMGRGGTDVARGAADLVLTDDNFASIVAGIEEGRITYANIRKIVIFLLATGIAEIGMFLGAVATGLPMPLTAVQLLWLNLVTNGVQDVMLGFGRGEGDELRQPPRRPKSPIVDAAAIALTLPPALAMTALALAMIAWAESGGMTLEAVQNGVLLLVVLFQNAYVLCMRSERRRLWREPVASNPWLLLGIATALLLQLAAMHWPPLRAVLGTGPVEPSVIAFCAVALVMTILVTETTKWIVHRR